MASKNIFDPGAKEQMIERIKKLTPESPAQWGKMNVSQMLAHLQLPIQMATGEHKIKRTFLGRIVGPLVKSTMYNDKPFSKNLPTDKSFIMLGQQKDFTTERINLIDKLNAFQVNQIVDYPHPFFGKLTREQWSISTWKHLDHHLRQFGV